MSGRVTRWNKENLEYAYKLALEKGTKEAGRELKLQPVALLNALNRNGYRIPWRHTGAEMIKKPVDRLQALINLTRKGPISFETACNKLDLSPHKLRGLLSEAERRNLVLELVGDRISQNTKPREGIAHAKVEPTVGKWSTIACISDTHLGSKYCLRAQLRDFILYAYHKRGVREILHSGDILDGDYKHGKFEMTHMGLDEQMRDLYETLPQLKGLTYHAISGNHDHTFTAETWVDVPKAIQNYFLVRGRKDWFAYGNRGATIRIHGALIDLWHPSGSVSYAVSYKMQKRIEGYAPGSKPHIVQIGHWHKHACIIERGVFAFAAGTFQGGGSEYVKSMTVTSSAIGGTILSWQLTKNGTMRRIIPEFIQYFEQEKALALRMAER